jgi:PKD repeat protein
MYKKLLGLTAPLAIVLLGSACTVQNTDIPGLAGPSELGLAIRVEASPDTITRNGYEQSKIIVTARDHNGAPKPDVGIRLDMVYGGAYQDLGTLVPRNLRTGADGTATAVYTSPPPTHPLLGGLEDIVSIVAVPVGTNAQSSMYHAADIRLMRPGVILAPADRPTARFTVTPTPVNLDNPVFFDASASCGGQFDEAGVCRSSSAIASYQWDFGDGGFASGPRVSHAFAGVGSYSVKLTVTNDRGLSDDETQTVSASASASPQAEFVFSPAQPAVSQAIQFNASASQAAPGRTIASYTWNWGDGSPESTGMLAQHTYSLSGSYSVTLTIVDDIGRRTTATRTVSVGTGNPTALFTFVVTNATTHTIQVDASASSAAAGASIASYTWLWGDGTSGNGAVQTKSYAAGNTYTVTLTVTDNLGRSGTTSQSITVP